MKIYLAGLSEDPKKMHFTQQDGWLAGVVAAVEADDQAILPDGLQNSADYRNPPEGGIYPDAELARARTAGPAALQIDVYKSQEVVVLKGIFKVAVSLMCSRCADSFQYPLQSHFHCLFTREKSFMDRSGFGVGSGEPEDIDIEFLDKEQIDLKDVLKEQLYLKIPFQPLCNEACKGLCSNCGQNQNSHPCQCHRIRSGPLANALKSIRL